LIFTGFLLSSFALKFLEIFNQEQKVIRVRLVVNPLLLPTTRGAIKPPPQIKKS
jgi:hypothetical protein